MTANELNEKTVEELNAALIEQLQEQFKLRMQSSTGQLTQTHLMKIARKNIARIKTVLRQKAGK